MDVLTLVILAVLVAVIFGFFFILHRLNELSSLLRGSEILERLERHKGELGANLKSLDERLHTVTQDIGGVKDVTGQLREFQESLRSQKLRGNVGEMILQDLLREVLPESRYEIQYTLGGNKKVDAIIKTSGGVLVPVDSKFPVENFQSYVSAEEEKERESFWKAFTRDVKKRMDETAQYIVPEEGTTPFALMYIPYEPIFLEVVSDSSLWRYALEKRVYFTSPQTFWVTLQFLTFGLRREKVAEQVEELIKMIHAVARDAGDFDELLSRAANQISNAKSNMDQLLEVFSSLLGKLERLEDLDSEVKK